MTAPETYQAIVKHLEGEKNAQTIRLGDGAHRDCKLDSGPGSRGTPNPHLFFEGAEVIVFKHGQKSRFYLSDPCFCPKLSESIGSVSRFSYGW